MSELKSSELPPSLKAAIHGVIIVTIFVGLLIWQAVDQAPLRWVLQGLNDAHFALQSHEGAAAAIFSMAFTVMFPLVVFYGFMWIVLTMLSYLFTSVIAAGVAQGRDRSQ